MTPKYAILGGSSSGQNFTLESCVGYTGLHRATPGYTGQTLYLKNTNTNTWTVTPFGSETIDGAANVSVASKATLELQSTLVSSAAGGCNWTQVQNN
jgi:hypothetical protein